MASLFDAAAQNPGSDGDKGVRWSLAVAAWATTANATRAHIVANNQLAGSVTPATFQDQGENNKQIDWFVLHHGNDFVILNLNSSITNASEVDFRVAFRENGGSGLWDFAISSDSSDSDPYEMPATQAQLDAIVAVITGGGTLDTIIYDVEVAGALPGWDGAALTYTAAEQLAMEATAGNPTATFDLRAIAPTTPEELAMAARAGNPTATFDLRAIAQDVQRLAVSARAGLPRATFAATFGTLYVLPTPSATRQWLLALLLPWDLLDRRWSAALAIATIWQGMVDAGNEAATEWSPATCRAATLTAWGRALRRPRRTGETTDAWRRRLVRYRDEAVGQSGWVLTEVARITGVTPARVLEFPRQSGRWGFGRWGVGGKRWGVGPHLVLGVDPADREAVEEQVVVEGVEPTTPVTYLEPAVFDQVLAGP